MPHPVDGFDQQSKQLLPLYEEMTKGLQKFIQELPLWSATNEETKGKVHSALKKLPQESLGYFKAQYFQLATKYEDFFVWSNLQEHKETRSQIKKMSAYLKKHSALAKAGQKSIDLGFGKLADIVNLIPHEVEARQANRIFDELFKYYKDNINQPIIKDPYTADEGKPTLTYPKKSDIFVPQSFKAIRFSGKEQLENEATWINIKPRNDIGTFLLSYLSSPYSTRAPLIILGHPGSGKSLLTQILSARLISPAYTTIRVELRDIDADNEIPVQIEEQIRKSIGREANWANLSDYFNDHPALVLLDGYDELLQASGKVFSGYLMNVQKFQERESSIRQPVRAIITEACANKSCM